jgi:hypothetical protein
VEHASRVKNLCNYPRLVSSLVNRGPCCSFSSHTHDSCFSPCIFLSLLVYEKTMLLPRSSNTIDFALPILSPVPLPHAASSLYLRGVRSIENCSDSKCCYY